VQTWQNKTGYDVMQFTTWLGIGRNKYYSWVKRQGQENQAKGVPARHHWLTETEKGAIINYYAAHRQTGYRRLAYMMLDENVAAVSPAASIVSYKRPDYYAQPQPSPLKKDKDSTSLNKRISIGTLTSPTSISVAPSTISAPFWMATAATSCIGKFGLR